jgi:hypothetical protein
MSLNEGQPMPERIIYVHERATLPISEDDIHALHQDYEKGSRATKTANNKRIKSKFLITVDKDVSFKGKNDKNYKVMFITARGPNLNSSEGDKQYFLGGKGNFILSKDNPSKTRVEVCLKQNYYNQLLAAKNQGADAIVLTLLSIGYYAGNNEKIKEKMLGYSMNAVKNAMDKFKAKNSKMKIAYTFDDLTGQKKHDSLDLAEGLIEHGSKNVAVSIAGADNSAGGKTKEAKEKYNKTKKLPKTQEENVKCRTDWDNSVYKKDTHIIRVNEASLKNRVGSSTKFFGGNKDGLANHKGECSSSYRPST